jgi:hypothetical protein
VTKFAIDERCAPKARVSRLDGVLWVYFGSDLKRLETDRFLDRR